MCDIQILLLDMPTHHYHTNACSTITLANEIVCFFLWAIAGAALAGLS